ncbi:MAG: 4Fe-4S dicluster domain-containing protein, partial [Planctomycetota bacterium]
RQFWKPDDIYDVECPNCQAKVEFWKDDIYRRCKKCGHRFLNPKLDIGCAEWCQHAKYCIGQDLDSIKSAGNKNNKPSEKKEPKNMINKSTRKRIRKIVKIDEDKCTGCGLCIPACAEGALQIINGKAKLVKDIYCDGLGACLGECPEGAITIEKRETEEFDEAAAKEHLKQQKTAKKEPLLCSCPSTTPRSFDNKACNIPNGIKKSDVKMESVLSHWPIQLMLVPPTAPFLQNCNLVIAADCVSYAYANFHQDFLKGKTLVIACPKLDDTEFYLDKLIDIFKSANIKSVTVLHMEVPCCSGLVFITKKALTTANKKIPAKEITISIQGNIKSESPII